LVLQATVGAGLPVIATLKHLIETGDRILKVSMPAVAMLGMVWFAAVSQCRDIQAVRRRP